MTATSQHSRPDPGADLEHEVASLRRRSTTLTIARGISYVAYAWVVVSLLILTFGFVLLLLNASTDAAFTQWVYRHLSETMEPFRGIFPQASTPAGSTVDVSVLFAMFVYSLIGLGVRSLIDWLSYRRDRLQRRIERDQALRQQQSRAEAQRAARQAPAGYSEAPAEPRYQ